MSAPRDPSRDPSVRALLEVVEAHLGGAGGFVSTNEHERSVDALGAAFAALEEAAVRRPDEAAALADRLERARSLTALRTREVPDGALDGVYEAVRARMDGAVDSSERALLRAGLSRSFLDAPRALAVWRRTAVAAIVVMGFGLGWWATNPVEPGATAPGAARTAGEPLVPFDPRDDLLPRLTPASFSRPAEPRRGRFVPMNDETRHRALRVFNQRPGSLHDLKRMLDAMGPRRAKDLSSVERN